MQKQQPTPMLAAGVKEE